MINILLIYLLLILNLIWYPFNCLSLFQRTDLELFDMIADGMPDEKMIDYFGTPEYHAYTFPEKESKPPVIFSYAFSGLIIVLFLVLIFVV